MILNSAATPSSAAHHHPFLLQCTCGQTVTLEGTEFLCKCGKSNGTVVDGVCRVAEPTPYWGEIQQADMKLFLEECATSPWRDALPKHVTPRLFDYVASPVRAAFQDVLPIPEGSSILDIGAGLGGIATGLAKRHRVLALEGVWERTQFMAVRKRQDNISNLTVVNGDLASVALAPGQFDLIVVNGVLEWAGLFDLSGEPEDVQRRFLESLRALLRPGGFIYVGIENRFGWDQFRGAKDHSGLPYTSLMPRWLARWVCSRNASHRSSHNHGYRTLTHSYGQYMRLFESASLHPHSVWIAPNGYNIPDEMVPLDTMAIRDFYSRRLRVAPVSLKNRLRNLRNRALAFAWFWRWFGSDYAFLIQKRNA